MYETTLNSVWSLFGAYLSGERQALILVVSSCPLNGLSRKALQSSFARLGYGKAACTFLSLKPSESEVLLSKKDLFTLLEGLDPKFLIISDKEAARICGQAYNSELPLDARLRLFGRETRVFASFETMITESARKQKAWALLKSLPRLSS